MREEWQIYWRRILGHVKWMPLGILIALVPALLNFRHLRQQGELIAVIGVATIYGLTIPLAVWLCFAIFYGMRISLAIKTGRELKVSGYVNLAVNFFGMVLGIWLSIFIVNHLFGMSIEGSVFFAAAAFGSIVIAVISLYAAYRQSREEALRLQTAVAEARYHTLEQQMRPHFLFNALNSLAELIESGREDAAETTYKLSNLYRRILANSDLKTATLESELEIARSYLELEQLRFGSRLNFTILAPENTGEIFLPTLMLQTLVENAIKHGIAPSVEGGQIEIVISRNGDGYHLKISNTGKPLMEKIRGGTGLANTLARLDLLYGEKHKFEIGRDGNRTVSGFRFTGEKID